MKERAGVAWSAPGQKLAEDTSSQTDWLFSLLSRIKRQSLKCTNLYIFVCKYSCYSLAMYSAHFTYLCAAVWGSNFGGGEGIKEKKKKGKKKLKASLVGDQNSP